MVIAASCIINLIFYIIHSFNFIKKVDLRIKKKFLRRPHDMIIIKLQVHNKFFYSVFLCQIAVSSVKTFSLSGFIQHFHESIYLRILIWITEEDRHDRSVEMETLVINFYFKLW